MGPAFFVGSILACWYLNVFVLDVSGVIVFFLGVAIATGPGKADYWALGFMGCYLLLSGLMVGSIAVPGFPPLQIGGRPIHPSEQLGAFAFICTVGLWATVNLCLLFGLFRQRHPHKQSEI